MLLCLVRLIWKLVGFRDHMLGAGSQHLFGTTRVINKLRQTLWVPTPPLTRLSASYGWHSNQFEHFHSFLGSPPPAKLFLCKGNPSLLQPTYIEFYSLGKFIDIYFYLMFKWKGGVVLGPFKLALVSVF